MIFILCRDLDERGNGLDLEGIRNALAGNPSGAEVRLAEGPCDQAERWLTPELKGADGLVLGLCGASEKRGELCAHARKLGIHPGAVQVVGLGGCCAGGSSRTEATARAALRLRAAAARVGASERGGPENDKMVFSWGQSLSRRSLFTLPPVRYEVIPSIRAEACAAEEGCRICAELCPHDALKPSGQGQMVLSRDKCTGCGACVSACPREAFRFPGASPAQMQAELETLLDAAAPGPPRRGILFVCHNSAARLGRDGRSRPEGFLPVEVPCLAMVTPAWILQCLNGDAEAVGLLPCPPEECRFGAREELAGRVDFCRSLGKELGLPEDAVRLFEPAGAEAPALPSAPPRGRGEGEAAESPRPTLRLVPQAAAGAALGLARGGGPLPERAFGHPHSPLGVAAVKDGCTMCGACVNACPTGALAQEEEEGIALAFRPAACVGCGGCVPVCPERVVEVKKAVDFSLLSQGKKVLFQDSALRCEKCGAPVAPRAMLDKIGSVLGDDPALSYLRKYCQECRKTMF